MADDTVLNPGVGGDNISTDDLGSVKVQRVKVQYGVDGSATDVSDTNPMPIDDAGGSITVDGTVTANLSATDNAVLDAIAASVSGSVPAGTNAIGEVSIADNNGVDIGDVDVISVVPGTSATELGKAEDAPHTTGDVGVMMLGVRQDTQADFGADGDYVPPSIDANGALRVNAINADGTSNADSVAGTADAGAVMLAIRDDSLSTLTQSELDYAQLRVNSTGALHVTSGATEYSEDSATPATIVGQASMMERDDVLAPLTPAEGDWASARCDANGALWTAVNNTVAVDGSAVTQPVSGTVTANLSATDNAVLDAIDAVLDAINAKLVTGTVIGDVNLGATDNAVLDSIASNTAGLSGAVSGSEVQVDVVSAIPAGTNTIGDVGLSVNTSGGTTLYKNIDVDESEDSVKATAGQIYWIHAINTTASLLYLKVYNATVASVVVGTTVPDLTFPVPAATTGAGFTLSIPNGIEFSTAITIAATTGVADADSGAPGANACIVNLGFA